MWKIRKCIFEDLKRHSFDSVKNTCKEVFTDIHVYSTCKTTTAFIFVYTQNKPHMGLNARFARHL